MLEASGIIAGLKPSYPKASNHNKTIIHDRTIRKIGNLQLVAAALRGLGLFEGRKVGGLEMSLEHQLNKFDKIGLRPWDLKISHLRFG